MPPRPLHRWLVLATLCLAAGACEPRPVASDVGPDGTVPDDVRADGFDASDAGGFDARPRDTAVVDDDAELDAALDVDEDTRATPDGPRVTHGCAVFEDRRALGASRAVSFSAPGMRYTPACLRIAVGQSVTFEGNFRAHPLRPGLAPSRALDPPESPGNPIENVDTGTTTSVMFSRAGVYAYYCLYHEGGGMIGAVMVDE